MSIKSPSRNPAGVTKQKPIALRLMPKELADATRVARKRGMTRSALARRAFLAGLPIVQMEES